MVKLRRNQLLALLRNSGIWTTRDRLGIQRAFKDTCIPKRNVEDTMKDNVIKTAYLCILVMIAVTLLFLSVYSAYTNYTEGNYLMSVFMLSTVPVVNKLFSTLLEDCL